MQIHSLCVTYCHTNMEIRRINVRTSVRDKITAVVLKGGLVYFLSLCQYTVYFAFFVGQLVPRITSTQHTWTRNFHCAKCTHFSNSTESRIFFPIVKFSLIAPYLRKVLFISYESRIRSRFEHNCAYRAKR